MSTCLIRAIVLEHHGEADQLSVSQIALGDPGPGEIRLRQTAIGINYHDIYVRSGLYQTLSLPGILGIEAVGIVDALGAGVEDLTPGDRVGYVSGGYGGYAEARNLPAELAIKLPAGPTDAQWAATLMKAFTACMLLRKVHRISAGDRVLVHAAAGGMGQLLCRWAARLGAVVIGTVGSPSKAAVARAAGASEIILYREEDVVRRVEEMTNGAGVNVVYDAVGADTFTASLQALGFCGHLVTYGQASGSVAPIAPSQLASRSLTLSRPIVFHYLRTPDQLRAIADEVFAALAESVILPIDPVTFPMEQVVEAHLVLERAQSPGGVVLLP